MRLQELSKIRGAMCLAIAATSIVGCDTPPPDGPAAYDRCESSEDCPEHLPECTRFVTDGGTGSFCSRTCSEPTDCAIENSPVLGACINVNAAGEHDPIGGAGICMRACSFPLIDCGNETKFQCVPLQNDPNADSICAPIYTEF
jgi:hypothetical protein